MHYSVYDCFFSFESHRILPVKNPDFPFMQLKDIAVQRLFNQQISAPEFLSASELLEHKGAMQAQDFHSSVWAVGLRLKNAAFSEFEMSYNAGGILRTHVMRPTWHLVANKNISWLLDLTAPQVLSQTKGRHRNLGLTDRLLKQCNDIFSKELSGGHHMTREELMASLRKHKIPVVNEQLSHILMNAELHKVICSGSLKFKKLTYALFDERVKKKEILTKDESIAKLARIYFKSHGPALAEDFQWWSGLTLREVKLGILLNEKTISSLSLNGETYYFYADTPSQRPQKNPAFLLPAYDEYVISYRDRSLILAYRIYAKVVSSNGIFRPVIVDGKGGIIGTWGYIKKNKNRIIEFQFFEPSPLQNSKAIKERILHYQNYLNEKVTLQQ
jgi:hypothetical protein